MRWPYHARHLPTTSKKKLTQVWRIAFFGRLEERKGIKLFVEAMNKLQEKYDILKMPDFEIYIVGPDAVIDMVCLSFLILPSKRT